MPGNMPPAPWMSAMMAGPGEAPKEAEKQVFEGKEKLEIALKDGFGDPIPGVRYRVTTPKGKVLEGITPQAGKVKIVGLAKGKCKVEWPDVAKDAGQRRHWSTKPVKGESD
jgi:hypothetical protein